MGISAAELGRIMPQYQEQDASRLERLSSARRDDRVPELRHSALSSSPKLAAGVVQKRIASSHSAGPGLPRSGG